MDKKIIFKPLVVFVVFAGLLFFSSPVRAEVYVEAYLGGVVGSSNSFNADLVHQPSAIAVPGPAGELISFDGKLNPAVVGGLKIGTWFVKEGFLGFNYPNWMKYLGFYLDFSYHRLTFRRQSFNSNISYFRTGLASPAPGPLGLTQFSSEGTAATLAFMFAARYGFFKDSEVPFGRLQPYVAVGPAIFFSTQEPTLTAVRSPVFIGAVVPYGVDPGSKSSVNLALAVEAGLRYMALKNVSIEASFKYRYAQPTYTFSARDTFNSFNGLPGRVSFTLDPTFHLFSFQVGAAYHF